VTLSLISMIETNPNMPIFKPIPQFAFFYTMKRFLDNLFA
jgi:hypothetical protein